MHRVSSGFPAFETYPDIGSIPRRNSPNSGKTGQKTKQNKRKNVFISQPAPGALLLNTSSGAHFHSSQPSAKSHPSSLLQSLQGGAAAHRSLLHCAGCSHCWFLVRDRPVLALPCWEPFALLFFPDALTGSESPPAVGLEGVWVPCCPGVSCHLPDDELAWFHDRFEGPAWLLPCHLPDGAGEPLPFPLSAPGDGELAGVASFALPATLGNVAASACNAISRPGTTRAGVAVYPG